MRVLTMTMASAAMDTTWTRLIGFGVDTVWALKRLDSSIAGGSEGVREGEDLGGCARLVVEDDVLVMWSPKARIGGAGD